MWTNEATIKCSACDPCLHITWILFDLFVKCGAGQECMRRQTKDYRFVMTSFRNTSGIIKTNRMTKRPFSNRIAAHSMTMPSEGIIRFRCTTYRIVGNIPKRKLGNLNKFKCKRAACFTTGTHEVSSSALNFRFMLNEFAFTFPIRRCCWPKHLLLKVLQSRCLCR